MVNLSRIDKNIYKSLGFKNKTIGQTMIKEVLQAKVTNYKTVPALVEHLKPRIRNLINLGFDINDKKLNKQLKSIKKLSKNIDKPCSMSVILLFDKSLILFKLLDISNLFSLISIRCSFVVVK